MTDMLTLETDRLLIRPFGGGDLERIHHILDLELAEADFGDAGLQPLHSRRRWLEWTILGYEQLALLYQPPYGDRALIRKDGAGLIGAVGLVPCLAPFDRLPSFQNEIPDPAAAYTPEVGLYYAVSPMHRRHGYATEAAAALADYAFDRLHLKRIVAMTTFNNHHSVGVMRKLGMRLVKNPKPEPPWLQVVGVLENRP